MKITNLKYWLKPKEKLFADFLDFTLDADNPDKRRIYIDRDSDILLVAHIDTVLKPKYIRQRKKKTGKVKRIYAHGLDDRLGCMIAYDLAKQLKTDLLICDQEEKCKSTGQFHLLKNYNWITEFDRAGGDVVTYELDSIEFDSALSDYWEIGMGMFSDISQLRTTACCMNVGIGYEFAHSKDSFICVETMDKQITKFRQFYHKYKDVRFVQDNRLPFDVSDPYTTEGCDLCGVTFDAETVFNYRICKSCFDDMLLEYTYATGVYL